MRKIGDEFERYVLKLLPEDFKLMTNSGARTNSGDIQGPDWVIECKVKSKSTVGITAKELIHVIRQAERRWKEWAIVVKNRDNRVLVLLDFNAFVKLLVESREKDRQINKTTTRQVPPNRGGTRKSDSKRDSDDQDSVSAAE